ncbi:hypothetical protein QO002_001113 [Pararhizobium capsulatum DSM 1112]|uniref:Cysteine rich repeat-containing protein n=1 Tax=Pararhizobium capsulatum DSM 1112 TaxID=1121113 RepID=A0ABU0BL43_9HYPH|nr:hypothetical protein [Pararhizobium capsulatum]MDQ0318975.1 hypothetical protein [Pararhizobium capsulatum DSM 1112]
MTGKFYVIALAGALLVQPALSAPITADHRDYACREAMQTTLKPAAPKALRANVLKACKAALADFRNAPEAACDRQTMKFPASQRLAIAYTCMTAMQFR